MSASDRQSALTATAMVVREVDPLLKDLNEKKQNFRRNVVSLAAELKEMRSRLATQEQCVAKETITRQEAEIKCQVMGKEVIRLQKSLEEKNVQLQASISATETYVEELDDLRVQLTEIKDIADASAISAKSAELLCSTLVKEIEEKTCSLEQYEIRASKLEEKLDFLLKGLRAREISEMQLRGEVSRIEHEVMLTLANVGTNIDCELQQILEASPRNFDEINKLLTLKDDEIAKLRDDIRIVSSHWKLKTKELESQLDKHRRADQELKKKVMKLEFCLHEAQAQTRKLQRMGERRDKALKELRDQLAAKQASSPSSEEKQNFWDTSGFKIVISMSMLVLVMFSKR